MRKGGQKVSGEVITHIDHPPPRNHSRGPLLSGSWTKTLPVTPVLWPAEDSAIHEPRSQAPGQRPFPTPV